MDKKDRDIKDVLQYLEKELPDMILKEEYDILMAVYGNEQNIPYDIRHYIIENKIVNPVMRTNYFIERLVEQVKKLCSEDRNQILHDGLGYYKLIVAKMGGTFTLKFRPVDRVIEIYIRGINEFKNDPYEVFIESNLSYTDLLKDLATRYLDSVMSTEEERSIFGESVLYKINLLKDVKRIMSNPIYNHKINRSVLMLTDSLTEYYLEYLYPEFTQKQEMFKIIHNIELYDAFHRDDNYRILEWEDHTTLIRSILDLYSNRKYTDKSISNSAYVAYITLVSIAFGISARYKWDTELKAGFLQFEGGSTSIMGLSDSAVDIFGKDSSVDMNGILMLDDARAILTNKTVVEIIKLTNVLYRYNCGVPVILEHVLSLMYLGINPINKKDIGKNYARRLLMGLKNNASVDKEKYVGCSAMIAFAHTSYVSRKQEAEDFITLTSYIIAAVNRYKIKSENISIEIKRGSIIVTESDGSISSIYVDEDILVFIEKRVKDVSNILKNI